MWSIVNILGFMQVCYSSVNISAWEMVFNAHLKKEKCYNVTNHLQNHKCSKIAKMNKALWETCLLRILTCKLTKDQLNNEISINGWRKHTLLNSFNVCVNHCSNLSRLTGWTCIATLPIPSKNVFSVTFQCEKCIFECRIIIYPTQTNQGKVHLTFQHI